MVLQVGTKNHYLFSAGEQRGVEIQLDPIRLTALLVGLVRLEQEVRAEGRRLTFSEDPITRNNPPPSPSCPGPPCPPSPRCPRPPTST